MKRHLVTTTLTLLAVVLTIGSAQAALQLEGQSGIFLNTLAYPISQTKIEASTHHVDLDSLGTVSTYNIATGLRNNIEVGYTRITSGVTGVNDQNIFLAKWQFNAETANKPAVALWAIHRDLIGSDNSLDVGVSLTKILKVSGKALVLDLGARSTKAIGLGLFGFNDDREIKYEGSAALFVTPKFAVGTEFKQQINGKAWRDIAFRYVASDSLNIDAGIANLNSTLDNQVALAITHTW